MRLGGSSLALLLVFGFGCAHAAPRAATVTAASPPVVAAAPHPQPVPELYDVSWSLRSGETTSWADAPSELHAFTVGRWECALGQVQSDDALAETALEVRRTRRLACTHASGATVQTQLGCALQQVRSVAGPAEPRTPDSTAPDAHAAAEAGRAPEREGTRELSLQLDDSPTLHLRCAPEPVTRLSLLRGDGRPVASLCPVAGSVAECSARPTVAAGEASP
jgi:hypothetical protein